MENATGFSFEPESSTSFLEGEPSSAKNLEKEREMLAMSLLTLQTSDTNNINNKVAELEASSVPMTQSTISDIFTGNWDNLSMKLTQWQKSQLEPLVLQNSTGAQCLLEGWKNESQMEEGTFCNTTWENSVCWPATPRGQATFKSCAELLTALGKFEFAREIKRNAVRFCENDGTWNEQEWVNNQAECVESYDIFAFGEAVHEIHPYTVVVGALASLLCLTAALAIFWHFRETLQCDRVILHCHLMVNLIIRSISISIITIPQVINGFFCKLFITVDLYLASSTIGLTFVQGFYLHSRVTTDIFNTENSLVACYIMGWVIPMFLVVGFDISTTLQNSDRCWFGYTHSKEMTILGTTLLIVLAVNVMFVINIVRIMMCENRNRDTEGNQFCRAVKATFLMCPLLSINYIMIIFGPEGKLGHFLVLMNDIMTSAQGISVSMLYCFCCENVQDALYRAYKRYQARNVRPCQAGTTQPQQDIPLLEHDIPTPPTLTLEDAVAETCVDNDTFGTSPSSSSTTGSPQPGPSRPAETSDSDSNCGNSDLAVECGSLSD